MARPRRLKTSRTKVTDVSQSSIGTFSTFRHCVSSGRVLQLFEAIAQIAQNNLVICKNSELK